MAVAEPTAVGRVIAAWPSFALIGSYELLMRQVRLAASGDMGPLATLARPETTGTALSAVSLHSLQRPADGGSGMDVRRQAWQWASANLGADGSFAKRQGDR